MVFAWIRRAAYGRLGGTMLLIILTSHRADCFALCADCLERHTDLMQFERILVMGNALEPAHRLLAQDFVARHANAELREFGPRGLKATMHALDEALALYPGRIVVKVDEDVFVMPDWLNAMRRVYLRHRASGCGVVSALAPNSDPGQAALHDYLCAAWPEYARSTVLHGRVTSHNPDYAVWLWQKILSGKLDPAYAVQRGHVRQQRIACYLNINCVLLDPEFLSLALPFAADYDESLINCVLKDAKTPFYGLLTPDALAHHYSFGNQQREVDAAVPLDAVRRHLLGADRSTAPVAA